MKSGFSLPSEPAKRPQSRTGDAWPQEHCDPAPAPELSGRILFLDDDPVRARTFLSRHPGAVWVQTAGECIARLGESWDEVHLDHDLGGEIYVDSSRDDCGMEVVRWLCSRPQEPPPRTWFVVHSHNADAANLMVQCLREHGYQAVYRPFGIDLLAWSAVQPPDEPNRPADEPDPPPGPSRLVPHLLGWLGRQMRRFRRTAPPPSNADRTSCQESCGSSNSRADPSRKLETEET